MGIPLPHLKLNSTLQEDWNMSHGNPSFASNHQVYAIVPALVDDATAATVYFPLTSVIRIWALVAVGATDITLDVKLQQATDSSGTGVKDIIGAAVTQIAATDDNKYVAIDVEPAMLDIANDFDHARLLITVGDGTAGAYVAGFVILRHRHMPVTQPAAFFQTVEVAG
jgi:hypothetical protein